MTVVLERKILSDAEMKRRREAVYRADRTNALEGAERGPETDAVFDAYIRGEIEAHEIAPRLKALRARH
ncbi:antitoxin VbhA family protein [Chelativorans sp. AA-79]|uniref:antitoxin VbhA family protein n=1 Tax=Chelativorans sp. AA-79 TaxID=3028735 RepID=UPI0023F6BDD6|nr:antitoxin VbhA family protein [Chelativorans sp. AA-79]WEX12281.1 antitoxin VbhA family protein [Chelativorans sp. AA-79]